MGWKEILGRRGGSEAEPALADRQQILAYMEELCRLRTPCQLNFRRDELTPTGATVESVGEESGSFIVSLSRALPPDIEEHPLLELTFPLDRGRFQCSVPYQKRGGYLQAVLGLPLQIKLAERRGGPRARFGTRERASVTLVQSLGNGIGAAGKVRNLSMGGLAMRVERMISIADDRRLPLSAGPFTPGQQFLLLRINDLPHSPMIECGASLAYAATTSEGPLIGLRFEGLGALEVRILEQVMQRRLPKASQLFPIKVRRSRADFEGGGDEAADEAGEAEWAAGDGEEFDAPDAWAAPLEAEEEFPEDTGSGRLEPKERLQRLKRAGRHLLLVMDEDLDRAILAGTLIVDGYRRIKEARNFTAALECMRTVQPDLIILDQRIGSHDAQQFLERLRSHGLSEEVPVVLLAEKADVRTALMSKAARISHVQVKPVDYDGSLKGVLERLLELQ
jgi:CheY-like chemotaxis protein